MSRDDSPTGFVSLTVIRKKTYKAEVRARSIQEAALIAKDLDGHLWKLHDDRVVAVVGLDGAVRHVNVDDV